MEDVGLLYSHLAYFTAFWSILQPFGLFYSHLAYFTAIWSILQPFGLFFTFWVCCTTKNLATLVVSNNKSSICYVVLSNLVIVK
jgi:hypothetical protein